MRRAESPCIHAGSNDMAFRRLSQLGGIVRCSFQETAPRKTAKNTVRFNGSQPPRWWWKFGGHNNTTIFDNIDIGDLLTPIRRCSSWLRCYQFSMSDVYIGRTLVSKHSIYGTIILICITIRGMKVQLLLFWQWGHMYHHHHNCFTDLFPGSPGWAGARRELLDFMLQGKINRGRHTDHPAGRHSIRTNQCPPPRCPHFLQAGCPSCHTKAAQPTVSKHISDTKV